MHRFKHLFLESRASGRNQPDAFVLFPVGALPAEQRDLAMWLYERARELATPAQEPSALEFHWHSSVN